MEHFVHSRKRGGEGEGTGGAGQTPWTWAHTMETISVWYVRNGLMNNQLIGSTVFRTRTFIPVQGQLRYSAELNWRLHTQFNLQKIL